MIQIETVSTASGKMDVIRDVEAVRRLVAELHDWKEAAAPYALSPLGLAAELQKMEEIISHGKP